MVKNKWTNGGFQPAKKNKNSSCSVRGLSIVVVIFYSLFRIGISHFIIGTGTLFVLLSHTELHDE